MPPRTRPHRGANAQTAAQPLRFEQRLVLHQWLLGLFGVSSFERLAANLKAPELEGFDEDNVTRFYHALCLYIQPEQRSNLPDDLLLAYDQNIVRHWRRITERRNHAGPFLYPKYFQYLALLFTEIYLDRYFRDADKLLAEFNAHVEAFNAAAPAPSRIEPYTRQNLNKLAFWMATGSGKTLLMHINILQYQHYLNLHGLPAARGTAQAGGRPVNRVILLTPNEGLSHQHLEEFELSGIEAELFSKEGRGLFTGRAVEILDIHKLREEMGEKTVAVDAFEGNNLVLVDEGHRGTSGAEIGAWMQKRNQLCENGFSFEYSATFGQAMKASGNSALEQVYAKCILFDYSYKYFYGDGYGKDYRILNLADDSDDNIRRRYLTACLLSFYQQLKLYREQAGTFRPFLLERPLWVFVGGSVNAVRTQNRRKVSDVVDILLFLATFVRERGESVASINRLMGGRSGLLDAKGRELFQGTFRYLNTLGLSADQVFDDIFRVLFNAPTTAALHVENLKGTDGEVALRLGDNDAFGVINVGDASALCKLCEEQRELVVTEKEFSGSLFRALNDDASTINVLIGSKKFTEGWSSWRVSTMGLMNIGRNEGPQIIQLFGRGVRLKGKDFSLKRSRRLDLPAEAPACGLDVAAGRSAQAGGQAAPKNIETLETLNIFGIRADYMRQFKEYLEDEGLPANEDRIEFVLPVIKNLGSKKLKMVRLREGIDFKKDGPKPALDDPPEYLVRHPVVVDWYPKLQAMASLPAQAGGAGRTNGQAAERDRCYFEESHLAFLDLDAIYFELQQFKNERAWHNLNLSRGTLAMLAQWIAIASQESFRKARTEPLITLGSAPLFDPGFRSVILGQLGESRLVAAIDADIAGEQAHAKALDADTKGPLRDIHRRVGTAILFESSGGQTDKVAHLPELRFALGEPEVDTTSVDNAAFALESRAYYIQRVGSDGFKVYHKATIRKAVSDRRASLDEETEIKPAIRKLVEDEFRRGASIPVVPFPRDGAEVPDTPKLTLVVAEPETEWTGSGSQRAQIAEWTKQRGKSPRLYPGSLVWCIKKPGRDLREKVELWLAWKRVAREVADGTLGGDFDRTDRAELQSKVAAAEEAAKDEVWGGYRFAVIADHQEPDGLKTIDLGAGHSSSGETLCGRVIAALKSAALLNESVGAGYIDRNWPPALKESGAWPLASLRQSFLNGSLTRLLDPDTILRGKIVEFVARGDFGLASGQKADLPAAPGAAQAGGRTIRTMWGWLAWQIDREKAFPILAQHDEDRVAPGGDVIRDVLTKGAGGRPVLILLDEVLKYMERAAAVAVLDSTLQRQAKDFFQNLTVEVSGSTNAALVYSLTWSAREALGNVALLAEIDKLAARVDQLREPVTGDEILPILQRRLLGAPPNPSVAMEVATAYQEVLTGMRRAHAESSAERQQAEEEGRLLRDRMRAAYPFHPALIDVMRERWTAVDAFQRTRGALRFLASCMYSLKKNGGAQPLLGPGDVPLNDVDVRVKMLKELGVQNDYDPVITADIEGPNARAKRIDERMARETPALASVKPATRLATAILLYSFGGLRRDLPAATRAAQAGGADDVEPLPPGVTESELLAACVGPDLDNITATAVLAELRNTCLYLHNDGARYCFKKDPNITKLIEDAEQSVSREEAQAQGRGPVREKIKEMLDARLAGHHTAVVWPEKSQDIPDEDPRFLVAYLPLEFAGESKSDQERQAKEYLSKYGDRPRRYRNGLGLAIPDKKQIEALRRAVRYLLAIERVDAKKQQLRLTRDQLDQLKERKRTEEAAAEACFRDLYAEVWLPRVASGEIDIERVERGGRPLQATGIHERIMELLTSVGTPRVHGSVTPRKVAERVRLGEPVSPGESPVLGVKVSEVLESFFRDIAPPRLESSNVVRKAIARGVAEGIFAYTSGSQPALGPNGKFQVARDKLVIGRTLAEDEVDFESGFIMVPAAIPEATPPPAPGPVPVRPEDLADTSGPHAEPVGGGTDPASVRGAPGPARQTTVRLKFKATRDQIFKAFPAIANLADKSNDRKVTVSVEGTSSEGFDPSWLRNAVEEPLDEADIEKLPEEGQ